MIVFQYPNCNSCKKALRWLNDRDIAFESIHIVDAPPTELQLSEWIARSGLPIQRFFNTSGMSYRQGGFKERLPTMSTAEKVAELCADGKLIKRPLLISDSTVLVGFKEKEYIAALGETA